MYKTYGSLLYGVLQLNLRLRTKPPVETLLLDLHPERF